MSVVWLSSNISESASIKALISSSSFEEWFNMESTLPALSESKDMESSGDFDRIDTLKATYYYFKSLKFKYFLS